VRPENKVPKNLKDGSGMKHILLTQWNIKKIYQNGIWGIHTLNNTYTNN
jgi:hypothetical protein